MAGLNYGTVIGTSWLVFLIVWGIGALNVKRDAGCHISWWHRYWFARVVLIMLCLAVLLRIERSRAHKPIKPFFLYVHFFTPGEPIGWIAAAVTVLGIALAIWARICLGRNWSSAPAVKEGHALVTSGPYRLVRHPIYTGILLAALGSALTGSIFAIWILAAVAVVFYRRIDKEERIMLELFPEAYRTYQSRTKRLIPWLF